MRIRPHKRSGFTLVEIIIVVMIMGLIMAWGMPTFVQIFKRKPLQQAVNDLMEACASARAAAIMTGATAELAVTGDSQTMQKIVTVQRTSGTIDPMTGEPSASGQVTSVVLPDSINIELMFVNLQDALQPDSPPARVRFYPNGTCDEFTISLLEPATNKRRMIHLDVITGHAELKAEEQIAQMKR